MKTVFQESDWIKSIAELTSLRHGSEWGWEYTYDYKWKVLPYIKMPVKTPYFAPFMGSDQNFKILDGLKKRYWYIHAHYPPYSGIQGDAVHYTYIHKFKDGFDFDYQLRKAIQKAEKENYEFCEGADLKDCYLLEQRAFERSGLDMNYATSETFENFVLGIPEMESFTIKLDGINIGYYLIVVSDGWAYAWVSAFDHEFQNTRLNQLLMVRMLEWCKDRGLEYFDFVGADTPSIANYKSQFNFELVPTYSLTLKKYAGLPDR